MSFSEIPFFSGKRHYYPFGLQMEGPFLTQVGPTNRYQYNGKEWNPEGELNWVDYGARWYDPVIARFPSLDPVADEFHWVTLYNYAENNPISYIDLWGLQKGAPTVNASHLRVVHRSNLKVVHRGTRKNVQIRSNPGFNPRNPNALTPPFIIRRAPIGFNVPGGGKCSSWS